MGKKISKPKKLKNTEGIPLAVVSVNGGVCLLEKTLKKTGNHLFLSWSTDGLNFSGDKRQVEIKISPRKKEKIETCSNFSLSGTPTSFIMTYVRAGKTRDKDIFVIAKSKDLYAWTVKSEVIRGDSNQAKACLIASIYPLSDRLIQKTGCWLYMRLPFAKTGKPCFRLEGYFLTIRTQSELFGDRKPLFGRELWS